VRRVPFVLFVFVVASAFAKSTEAPDVIFVSPCECQGFHGKNRWVTKTDQAPVPSDKSAIQPITPSQIYAWKGIGPDVDLTRYTEERMPSEQKWCEIRQTVFSWTTQTFPFGVKTAHTLKIREPYVITVTGKAFYDIGHAPADHSNRRSKPEGYAVWEIHPVMKIEGMQ